MAQDAAVRATVYGALGASVALLLAAPSPASSLRTLRDAGAADVVTDPVVALVALLAWAAAAYLLTVTAVTAGGHLPGAAGQALRAVARRVAPGTLRRALEVALGVTLAVGTLGAGTASAAGPLPDRGLVAQTGSAADLPMVVPLPEVAPEPGSTPSLDHPVAAPTPSLDHPVAVAAPQTPADLDWPGAAPPAPAVTPTSTEVPADDVVVVQPGDSLWELAEERLVEQTGARPSDAQVAQAWPSWWQANREAVGDDPDLLHPGTPLVPPTDT